jgi:hypothetical protein
MATDDGELQVVFALDQKDGLRFKTAIHTDVGLQVETFTVKSGTLRVFIRKGNGVRILQEDCRYPEIPSAKWDKKG